MHRLENDYPGDADWQQYVALYEEDYLDENALGVNRPPLPK